MRFRYALDEDALVSVREQLIWFEKNSSEEIADFWVKSLETCIDEINAHPERNGFAPENWKRFADGEVRQKRFRPWKGKPGWRVLYMIEEIGAVVKILQIRNERQPWLGE